MSTGRNPDPDGTDERRVAEAGPTPGDDVLVARAIRGDPYAFERLIRRHQRHMYAVALRITGRPADAEDATQSAFVAAWRRLPEFRRDSAFGTWLYRIVSNRALNQVRSRRRTDAAADVGSLPEPMQPRSREAAPADCAQTDAMMRDLRAAVAALPAEQRTCWWAHEVDGYSYEEVATITATSYDIVRGRIYRARKRLAAAMEAWR